jgi:hypothetical protein
VSLGYADTFETTPFVGNNGDLDEALGDPWYPLFSQDDQVNQSPLLPEEEELDVSEQRRQLDPRRCDNSNSQSASAVSGISSRNRTKPLLPIVVDPNDAAAIKRARSTLAARKSRQRKLDLVKELERRVATFEKDRSHWKEVGPKANKSELGQTHSLRSNDSTSCVGLQGVWDLNNPFGFCVSLPRDLKDKEVAGRAAERLLNVLPLPESETGLDPHKSHRRVPCYFERGAGYYGIQDRLFCLDCFCLATKV